MQFGQLKRRDFITLLSGTAAAWPLAARAQQAGMPVIGFVAGGLLDPRRAAAYRKGLNEAGYVEGQNVNSGVPLAGGPIRPPAVAHGRPRAPSRGRHRHAREQPCCACSESCDYDNPDRLRRWRRPGQVGSGCQSRAARRQRDRHQFFSQEVTAKRLGLLHELVPKAVRIAVLLNPANIPSAEAALGVIPEAARAFGLQIQVLNAGTSREIEAAFATLLRDRSDALFVAPDGFFNGRRVQLAIMAGRHAIPATYSSREYVEAGGLMSYGANVADAYRQAGVISGQILKGAKPADLPVTQSTKFELVINLPTARALGLDVPPVLLARADEVIE
jgi:putative ABC transport system substrate-binding protein